MTEAEWLSATDPALMLEFLKGKASDRKLRLFGVECCRRVWDLLTDERSRAALECAARVAEGMVTQRERREAYRAIRDYADDFAPDEAVAATLHRLPAFAASEAANWAAVAIGAAADFASTDEDHIQVGHRERDLEKERQAVILREILGNPFRPVSFDPAWLTTDVRLLARGIYEEKAFERMPILADALQDAGCDSDDLLNHLRDSERKHVRGCWALDLVLGKL